MLMVIIRLRRALGGRQQTEEKEERNRARRLARIDRQPASSTAASGFELSNRFRFDSSTSPKSSPPASLAYRGDRTRLLPVTLSPARFAAETPRGQRFSASGLTFYDRESFPDRVRYRPDRICTAQSVAGLKRVMIAARSPSNPINLPASRVDGAAREDPGSPGTVIFLFPRRGMRCIGNQECPLTAEK